MQRDHSQNLGWKVLKTQRVLNWLRYPTTTFAASVYFAGIVIFVAAIVTLIASVAFLVTQAFSPELSRWSEAQKLLIPTLVAVLSAPFLVWRLITGHWQAVAARRQADIAFAKQETDLRNNISTAIMKAVEILGATRERKSSKTYAGGPVTTISDTVPNLEARCGAILSLAKLSRDNKYYSTIILQSVCAYIRDQSWFDSNGIPRIDADKNRKAVKPSPPRIDVGLAIEYLFGRSELEWEQQTKEKIWVNLRGACLQAIVISKMSVQGISFRSADMRLSGFASLRIYDTEFVATDVDEAVFNGVQFVKCRFESMSFEKSIMTRVEFDECEFRHVSDFRIFQAGEFRNCSFVGITFDSLPSKLLGSGNRFEGSTYWDGNGFAPL